MAEQGRAMAEQGRAMAVNSRAYQKYGRAMTVNSRAMTVNSRACQSYGRAHSIYKVKLTKVGKAGKAPAMERAEPFNLRNKFDKRRQRLRQKLCQNKRASSISKVKLNDSFGRKAFSVSERKIQSKMTVSICTPDNVVRTFDLKGYDNIDGVHYFDFFGFDAKMPHNHTQCEGNCSKHPLMRPDYLMTWGELNEREFDLIEAAMTAFEKQERAAKLLVEDAARKLTQEALIRERYARDVKEKAQMGLKRNEKPKKIQQPCKWVVGEFKGDECWAYEYTDPKTGKRECPHTCQRLHIGEEGWHDEWLTSPRWKPAAPAVRNFNVTDNSAW